MNDSQLQAEINGLEKQAHEHNDRADDYDKIAKQASMQNNKSAYEKAKQKAEDERKEARDRQADADELKKHLKQREQPENQKSRDFQTAQKKNSHSVAADPKTNDGTEERLKRERDEAVAAQERTKRAMEAERKVQEAKQREALTHSDNGYSR